MAIKKVTGKPRFQNTGPVTAHVFAAITPGQLGAKGTAGNAALIGPAGAGVAVLGVATTPGFPPGTANTGTSPSGYPMIDPGVPDDEVAFARKGAFYLNATGVIAYLDFVKSGVNGSVVKWDPAADQAVPQVGQCIDPDGATNGSVVLVDLNIQG